MAVRPIDGNKLIEWFSPYLHTGEPIPADVVIEDIRSRPTLTPPNEWVSVEDRLPENEQEVLVYWRNTSQKAEHFEITHYTGNHWFLLDNTSRPWIEVIAWMPLPEPPEARG